MKGMCKFIDPTNNECSRISAGSDGMIMCNYPHIQPYCHYYEEEEELKCQ
jgi:hypothetical protein